MNAYSQKLHRVIVDLGLVTGTVDRALARAEDWAQTDSWLQRELPDGDDEPAAPSFDALERKEQRKVVARATEAMDSIPKRVARLEADAAALRKDVAWLVATVDPSKLPEQEASCKSCRRVGEMGKSKIGGHFSPVWDRCNQGEQLCRWCQEYKSTEKQLPPLEAVELYHSQSPRAAGLWLARLAERKSA